jgi:hypothetical protein
MSTKKTIQISPELFKIAGNKTRKNKDKKQLVLSPTISPSNLKNKLLKRIKDHKTNELKNITNKNNNNSNTNTENTYTDEFYGAIDYLSGLSKKQKQQKILNNTTLKNNSSSVINSNLQISLDLPQELSASSTSSVLIPQNNDIFNINYKSIDDVPYGCLKNGNKKTYREWKGMSSLSSENILPDLVRPPTPPKKNVGVFLEDAIPIKTEQQTNQAISREARLEQIKNKLRKLEDHETSVKRQNIEDFKKIEKEMTTSKLNNITLDDLPDFEQQKQSMPDVEELLKEREEKIEKETPKQYLKKTVKRKFTLGKSDKLRRIAVLIKDRQTRKNIINTQKELKKMNITDVRKYLRQHGIIKVGSTCPPDILRKTFEAAVMTGEVTNTNKDTLLYNFLNEDKS